MNQGDDLQASPSSQVCGQVGIGVSASPPIEFALMDKLPQLSKLLPFLWEIIIYFNNITFFRGLILKIKVDHTCKTLSTVLGTE